MVIALSPASTFDYVPQSDRDKPRDQQTTFRLRHLTLEERMHCAGAMLDATRDEKNPSRTLTTSVQLLRIGIESWTNFRGADGAEVPCVQEARHLNGSKRPAYVSDASLAAIPMDLWSEIAATVLTGSQLEATDVKN
jgi:hypothetical protein